MCDESPLNENKSKRNDTVPNNCLFYTYRSTAAAGQTRSTEFEANFAVQAAEANLPRATSTVRVIVVTAIRTAQSTAKNNVLFVNSVVSTHSSCFTFVFNTSINQTRLTVCCIKCSYTIAIVQTIK